MVIKLQDLSYNELLQKLDLRPLNAVEDEEQRLKYSRLGTTAMIWKRRQKWDNRANGSKV